MRKKQLPGDIVLSETYVKDFIDMVAPTTIKFFTEYYLIGDDYRCAWAIREYPPKSQKIWNVKRNVAKRTLVPLCCAILLYTASTYGATFSATPNFIKYPHTINFKPSIKMSPLKLCFS